MNLHVTAMVDVPRAPLSENAEQLRKALVDSAALARLVKRGWAIEVRSGGSVVGKRLGRKARG